MSRLAALRPHLVPSLVGWLRAASTHPVFGLRLLLARAWYFLTHRLPFPVEDPSGFVIDSGPVLVSYWLIFIERELQHPTWIHAIRRAQQPVAVDVGANAGVFCHLVTTIEPRTHVIAVDPQPQMVERVRRLAQEKALRVDCVQAACSDHVGRMQLYLDAPGDVAATLEPSLRAGRPSMDVDVVTLDSIPVPGNAVLLKVDAEGHDLAVLRGAKELLSRVSWLIIEAHVESTRQAIHAFLGPHWSCAKVGVFDYLFTRESSG